MSKIVQFKPVMVGPLVGYVEERGWGEPLYFPYLANTPPGRDLSASRCSHHDPAEAVAHALGIAYAKQPEKLVFILRAMVTP